MNDKRSKESYKAKRSKRWYVIFPLLCVSVILLAVLCACTRSDEQEFEQNTKEANQTYRVQVMEEPMPVKYQLTSMPLLSFQDPDNENLADLLQKNGSGMMVSVQSGKRLGSGVIYKQMKNTLVILTAAHVLEDSEEIIRVSFIDGLVVESEECVISEITDFAFIYVALEEIPQENLDHYITINIDKESFDAIRSGDGCIVMGSRSGVGAECYEGRILDHWIYMEDYDQYMIWVKAEGIPGMSGGGLFDQKGHFLGLLSGRNDDELAVVPLSLILAEGDIQ